MWLIARQSVTVQHRIKPVAFLKAYDFYFRLSTTFKLKNKVDL